MKKRYNIATSTENEAYYIPVYVMLFSLFENNKEVLFNIYVFYSTLSKKSKDQLETLAKTYGHVINWIQVTNESVASYYTAVYVSTATYYRILAPALLPEAVEKLLFLDADIIVAGSITDLLNTDMKGFPLMAVKEVIPYKIERLGIHPPYDYFNGGVLLMELSKWRSNAYHKQIMQNIEREKSNYLMFDQDALNAFFYDKVDYLSPLWNHQTGFYHISHSRLAERYGLSSTVILEKPVIIHFIGEHKPWHYICTHPYKQLFLKYLYQTPFQDFEQKPDTVLFTKKTLRRIKHKIKKIFL